MGGLGLAGGHNAEHPAKVFLQGGVQQGTACGRQTEQRGRAGLCKAGGDLLIFRCGLEQGFVHGKTSFLETLSVIAGAMPAPPKGGAFDKEISFII